MIGSLIVQGIGRTMLEAEFILLLDAMVLRLERDPTSGGSVVADLAVTLHQIKRKCALEQWKTSIAAARSHRLCALVHQDPLTCRAFTKPRGYQGDAELLDVIYAKSYAPLKVPSASVLGEAIFNYTIDCQAPGAVRERKGFLAEKIDETSTRMDRPHVLSVACGHLRELEVCQSVRNQKIGRFVGLDQDPASIESVRTRHDTVEVIEGSTKLLLGGALTKERFDFIYAAGLYDYLEDRLADRLTEKMFGMLNSGGRLLVANYLPDIPDVGYMETYMGWELIYRSDEQLQAVAKNISAADVSSTALRHDSNNNIAYLVLEKN